MRSADGPSRGTGRAVTADLTAKRPKPPLKKVLPEVWALILPRKWLIAGSLLLMVINRLCSFVLPLSARRLINGVMVGHDMHLLPRIIAAVAAATFVQGITSYSLTQLLSTEGQRLISQLRMQVQSHIGRLPVAFTMRTALALWSRASCPTSKGSATWLGRGFSTSWAASSPRSSRSSS